ncbi:MAG: hypothetical protein WCO65_01505 [bacterium]
MMTIPTTEQIDGLTLILRNSIEELIDRDSDIFNVDLIEPEEISDDARILNRELHETCINHRLAYYLEKNIQNTELDVYKVDIEYNRYYRNLKLLQTVNGQLSVRPDIILHSRVNADIQPQHYLVVEAKKAHISRHDIIKVEGFITDDNYNYVFGFTISYCSDNQNILGILFYFDGTEIARTQLNVPK